MDNIEPLSAEPMRVMFLIAEADPFVKVGGLGDVGGSLPKALRCLDPNQTGGYELDIRLVIPFHPAIDREAFPLEDLGLVMVSHAGGALTAQVFSTDLDGLPVYLISGPPFTADGPVYSRDARIDGNKFTFFSLASLELARILGWSPHILHANDWHTSMAVYQLARTRGTDPFFSATRTVLSLHNLPFMGVGAEEVLEEYGLPASDDKNLPEWARQVPLPLGLSSADQIVTVSPGYAEEILTPEFGCGLEDLLLARREALCGILNGLNMHSWDPAIDNTLRVNYSEIDLSSRGQNKLFLQEQFGFNPEPTIPLLILIGRMDPQKGVDLVLNALPLLTHLDWQIIILGTGDPLLEKGSIQLAETFPERVRTFIRFDSDLARQLYAGGDMILMPSRYEPCGLAQMIAMRYGCVPVARATGGLRDTILDYSVSKRPTGFLFSEPSPPALSRALETAFEMYKNKQYWQKIQVNGMTQDFSWEKSAIAYSDIYRSLIGKTT